MQDYSSLLCLLRFAIMLGEHVVPLKPIYDSLQLGDV